MSHDSAAYLAQATQLMPRGLLWDSLRESNSFRKLLAVLVDEFTRIDGRVNDLISESDPRTALELLQDWERFANLPDLCGSTDHTLQSRRDALHERLVSIGGQSRSYIIEQAARIGHQITITEFAPFISGIAVAGDELIAHPSDRYAWQVNVPVVNTYAFVAGVSVAGEELGYWQPINLECLFKRIQPSHTFIMWHYLI